MNHTEKRGKDIKASAYNGAWSYELHFLAGFYQDLQ